MIANHNIVYEKFYKFCGIIVNHPYKCFGAGTSFHFSSVIITALLFFFDWANIFPFVFDDISLLDKSYEPYQCFKAWQIINSHWSDLGFDKSLRDKYEIHNADYLFQLYYDSINSDNILTPVSIAKIDEFESKFLYHFVKIKRCRTHFNRCSDVLSVVDILKRVNSNDSKYEKLQLSIDLIMNDGKLNKSLKFLMSKDFRKNKGIYVAKSFRTDVNLIPLGLKDMASILIIVHDYHYEYDKYWNLYFDNTFFLGELLLDQVRRDAYFIIACMVFIFGFTWLQTKSSFVTFFGIMSVFTTFFTANLIHTIVLRIDYFGFLHILSIFLILGLGCDNIYVFFDRWRSFQGLEEISLTHRLTMTYTGVGWSMFITSMTTALAFFILIWTPLLTISTFGIFMTLLILLNYLSVLLYFPTVVIVYHLKFENVRFFDKAHIAVCNFFKIQYYKLLRTPAVRYSVLIAFTIMNIVALYFVTQLKVSEGFPQLLVSWTLHGKMEILKSEYYAVENVDENIQVVLAVGIKGLDISGCKYWKYKCDKKLIFDNKFQINNLNIQMAFKKMCDDLINASEMVTNNLALHNDSKSHIACLTKDMDNYFMEKYPLIRSFRVPWDGENVLKLLILNPTIYGEKPPTKFPYKFETVMYFFLSDGYTFSSKGYSIMLFNMRCQKCLNTTYARFIEGSTEFGYGFQLNFSAIIVNITLYKYMSSFTEKSKVFSHWIAWNTKLRSEVKYFNVMVCGSQTELSQNGYFHWIHVQQILNRAAISGVVVGLAVAAPVIFFATRNIYTFGAIMLGTILSTLTVVSLISVSGWNLGLLESINVTIIVGLTIDYPVHIGLSYNHSNKSTRQEKIQDVLEEMGISILSGMITTLGSAFLLLFCKVNFLFKFGTFVLVTILSAAVYSLVFLPCLFLTCGPQMEEGKVINPFKKN